MQKTSNGWLSGLLGVLIFSGSLPATRLAVQGVGDGLSTGFDPLFLTFARASIAGILALVMLVAGRQPRPQRGDAMPLCLVAVGVVIGFPLLTALALRHITSAHAVVFIGLLPLATAIFGVLRGGERPQRVFWVFSLLGSSAVVAFALRNGVSASVSTNASASVGSPFGASAVGDALMLLAILVCGLGYAEGARLSRRFGGWQVICWALVLCLPLTMPLAWWTAPDSFARVGGQAWAGLAYVSLFSMLVGFVFWYRGLALGGITGVGQLQLLQPFFGLLLSALVLHEPVPMSMAAVTVVVVACVAGAKRFTRAPPVRPAMAPHLAAKR